MIFLPRQANLHSFTFIIVWIIDQYVFPSKWKSRFWDIWRFLVIEAAANLYEMCSMQLKDWNKGIIMLHLSAAKVNYGQYLALALLRFFYGGLCSSTAITAFQT